MKRKTVLLIDDSSTNNLIFSDVLFEHNIQSIMAMNGLQALEILEETTPNLILLDMNMPEMNGIKFLEAFKAMEKEIPVLVMSAKNDSKSIKLAKHLGAKDYFLKPVDIRKFMKKVKIYLELHN